ncbi:MAG: acyl-CoA dehydratase activase [Dorea sp.]|nr:acyl-CoA dehydratase activase [Dorea sp.]
MKYIGIDIGSTCAKTAVLNEKKEIEKLFVIPTGWSSFQALETIQSILKDSGIDLEDAKTISTGYGRKAVAFANKAVTEITCHGRGAAFLFGDGKISVIDVGGQDTKVISCNDGRVEDFYMNDKCSAGTGKFVEIMANRLNIPVEELGELAKKHTEQVTISSMCTVFAESEIVSLIGQGASKENIAWGVLNSIAVKVKQEYGKLRENDCPIYLTGGLCESDYFLTLLSERIGSPVVSDPRARFAGAIGAALIAAR